MTEEGEEKERGKEEYEGEEKKAMVCPQLRLLHPPVVTMGLFRTVSEKNSQFQSRIANFFISRVFYAPSPNGVPLGIL